MGRTLSPERHVEQQAVRRRSTALNALGDAIAQSAGVEAPAPVTSIEPRKKGVAPKLPAEAFELARQVYYLQFGTRSDAAHAIIAAGLSDTDDHRTVYERLKTWWEREGWPTRATSSTFAIRDANHDGGLYRSHRICDGAATGSGPAPKGKPCTQSALPDSTKCFHHDPRPEYVDARRIQAARLRAGRLADQVPIEPFQRWCDGKRLELLAEAKASGRRLHPNNKGWGLLANAMGWDASQLARLMKGKHHRHPDGIETLRAGVVSKLVAPLGLTFRDVYGYDAPQYGGAGQTCPECDGPKNHESQTCRSCYEAAHQGEQCTYVNRRQERCAVLTTHESGICGKHRRIVERVPKPRVGRPSWITAPMLILALDEYRKLPIIKSAATRMWAVNAGGVRDVFASQKVLTGSLVKQFRKRAWHTAAAAQRAYDELVAEHGPVEWPTDPDATVPVDVAGLVPLGPFRAWLARCYDEVGSYTQMSNRLRMNPDTISRRWMHNSDPTAVVYRSTVDQALERWGAGTTFRDLYGRET